MTEEERIEFEKLKLEEERKKVEYEKGLRTGKIIPTATRNPIEDPNTDSESQSDSEDDTKVKGNDDKFPNFGQKRQMYNFLKYKITRIDWSIRPGFNQFDYSHYSLSWYLFIINEISKIRPIKTEILVFRKF